MKKINWIFSVMIAGSVMVSCKQAPDSTVAEVSDAKEIVAQESNHSAPIDLEKSMVEWIGTKVTTYHNGTIDLKSGELLLNNGSLVGGEFTFNMISAVSKDPKMSEEKNESLTEHLLSADFFDVENHPEAKFVIASVKPFSETDVIDGENGEWEEISEYKLTNPTHVIEGNLTMRGVTKGISFPAEVTIDGSKVEAKTKFNFNRMEWGVVYAGASDNLISELVHMGIVLSTK